MRKAGVEKENGIFKEGKGKFCTIAFVQVQVKGDETKKTWPFI